jgi:hypothetical protein
MRKLQMTDEVNVRTEEKIKSSTLSRSAITMIILLLAVSVGVIALSFTNGNGEYNDKVRIKESSESLLSRDSENAYSLPGDANIGSPYSLLSPSNQELFSSIPGLVTGQSKLSDRISSLSSSTESLTRGLADFKAEMDTTLYTKFQALDQQSINSVDMRSQLTLLNKNFQDIKESVALIKKQIAYKAKKSSKPIKKNKSLPPFKLMSVQIWNSKPIAIVSHQKTKIGIGINEVLVGWNIDSILMTGCMEVSQHSQSVKLCL